MDVFERKYMLSKPLCEALNQPHIHTATGVHIYKHVHISAKVYLTAHKRAAETATVELSLHLLSSLQFGNCKLHLIFGPVTVF